MKNKLVGFVFLSVFALSVFVIPKGADAATKRPCKNGFCPALVSITKGADEKQFANPVTRCLTKEITAMYQKAVAQSKKDIAGKGIGHEKAVQTYQDKLDISWDAMHEPYCGYGSYGLVAVKKSFQKSLNNARTQFLDGVKLLTLK